MTTLLVKEGGKAMERKKRAQSETDVALGVLRARQAPMHYKDLIAEVLVQLGEKPVNPAQRLAQIHTEINLDSRFVFIGKGMWGLASWSPKTNRPVSPTPNERNYQPKHSDYVWEDAEEEEDDESECLVPVDDEEDLDEDFPLDEDDEAEPLEDEDEDEPEGR